MSYTRPHEDRIGTGGSTATEVLTRTGSGIAVWQEPAGGGSMLRIRGPYPVTHTGVSDIGLALSQGDIILQTFAVTKTAPSAPVDGDELRIILERDAGGNVILTEYDLFNGTQTAQLGSAARFSIGLVAPWFTSPDQAYIDHPKAAVILSEAVHISVFADVDSNDGTWDVFVVMQEQTTLSPFAGKASATGAAYDATPSSNTPPAGHATADAAVQDTTAMPGPNAGHASASGSANAASASGNEPHAGLASGTGAANSATVVIS